MVVPQSYVAQQQTAQNLAAAASVGFKLLQRSQLVPKSKGVLSIGPLFRGPIPHGPTFLGVVVHPDG